jgi:hypothetical protein
LKLITNDFNGIFRVDIPPGEKFLLSVSLPVGGHSLDSLQPEALW